MLTRLLAVVSIVIPPTQPVVGQSLPIRELFTSDTMDVVQPTISPDGRWLVFVQLVSNHESRLLIRPLAGGAIRTLPAPKDDFVGPAFTPRGDRLLLVSSLPRRDASDQKNYLVGAPFDTETGTLTGPFRQVTLDGIVSGGNGGFAISPDGNLVAYRACCSGSAIRVVPVAGGNARTLAEPDPATRPAALAWSPDGKALYYNAMGAQGDILRFRVELAGGAPSVVVRSPEPLGLLLGDNLHSLVTVRSPTRQWALRVFDRVGAPAGQVPIPSGLILMGPSSFAGKYLVGFRGNTVTSMKLAPVEGGPIRTVLDGDRYDWPQGWTADGRFMSIALGGSRSAADTGAYQLATVGMDGQLIRRTKLPEGGELVAEDDEFVVYRTDGPPKTKDSRLYRLTIKDGTIKELTGPVLHRAGGGVVSAGGMYYGMVGTEFYYRQLVGDRLQLRAMTTAGDSRLLREVPARLATRTSFSVYRDRLAYLDPGPDSLRLQVTTGTNGAPRTIEAFPPRTRFEGHAWSHDGRQLFLTLADPQRLLLYRFDPAGLPLGKPREIVLPFEYWYEAFWLPDGTGLTMIAQPRGMAMTHVALVRLADPDHPILITRDDPANKWGYALSPDGKYVVYPSETINGSSIHLLEVTDVLKAVKESRRGGP